jgi:hypothetical protein
MMKRRYSPKIANGWNADELPLDNPLDVLVGVDDVVDVEDGDAWR